MATVCGTSLSLMDAGVPFQKSVAGVAMGLIKEKNFVVFTDILGDEDHLGDMDFKVAGTVSGIIFRWILRLLGLHGNYECCISSKALNARSHILDKRWIRLLKNLEKALNPVLLRCLLCKLINQGYVVVLVERL